MNVSVKYCVVAGSCSADIFPEFTKAGLKDVEYIAASLTCSTEGKEGNFRSDKQGPFFYS